MTPKVYLGDSVYATVDSLGRVILTTENGFGPSNTIYLEPFVVKSLFLYCREAKVFNAK
jgi:hypothetical protein